MTTVIPAAAVLSSDWTATLAGQALVFQLLGRLFYEPPAEAWLQSLAGAALFDEVPFGGQQPEVRAGLALLQQWQHDFTASAPAAQAESLLVDYTRLFVGPGKLLAPPYESAQVDEERLLFQEETLAVRAWYRRYGVELVNLHHEPDDHVGLELAFLAHLAQLALAAQTAGDQLRLAELLEAQRAFLAEHPRRWLPGWCAQVVERARTGFYQGAARLTAGMLAEVAASLAAIPQVEGL